MVDNSFYFVSEAIARRAGVIGSRYRITDGRFVLDTKDLTNLRLTSEEFLHGLQGIEEVTKSEALVEIRKNNFQMGTQVNAMSQSVDNSGQEQSVVEETNSTAEAESETTENVETSEVEQQPAEEEETAQTEVNEATEEEQAEVVDNEETNVEQTNEEEE